MEDFKLKTQLSEMAYLYFNAIGNCVDAMHKSLPIEERLFLLSRGGEQLIDLQQRLDVIISQLDNTIEALIEEISVDPKKRE